MAMSRACNKTLNLIYYMVPNFALPRLKNDNHANKPLV